jgi:hypothetical protein
MTADKILCPECDHNKFENIWISDDLIYITMTCIKCNTAFNIDVTDPYTENKDEYECYIVSEDDENE